MLSKGTTQIKSIQNQNLTYSLKITKRPVFKCPFIKIAVFRFINISAKKKTFIMSSNKYKTFV